MQGEHPAAKRRLFETVASLSTAEECAAFFEDLCTIKELQDMSQRLETAVLLDKGYNYQSISAQVGASTATISRVSRALNYGANGYRIAIDRMKENTNEAE